MTQPHVVIIGAGFGGLYAAKELCDAPVRVTILDRSNYHLFQPLLYQVATTALSPGEIAQPIRRILRGCSGVEVFLAEVTGIEREILTYWFVLCVAVLAYAGQTGFPQRLFSR